MQTTIYHDAEGSVLHASLPGCCKRCRSVHYVFRNLYGETVCIGCVPVVEREWAERMKGTRWA